MSTFNAHWCNGLIAAPIFELCIKQVWFKELNKKKSSSFSDVLKKHKVSNSVKWLSLLHHLEMLGLLNSISPAAVKMQLSELYRFDSKSKDLSEHELLILNQIIHGIGELEQHLKLSMAGVILLLILTRIRELGEDKFFADLQSGNEAASKSIHIFMAEHGLFDEKKLRLSNIGQQYIQHQELTRITNAKAFLATLSDWVEGKRPVSDTVFCDIFAREMSYAKINSSLTELFTNESAQADSHTIVFSSASDPVIAQELVLDISGRNSGAQPHKLNVSYSIEDTFSSRKHISLSDTEQLKKVLQTCQLPKASSTTNSLKTIIFDSLRESIPPVKATTDSPDVVIHATEVEDVFCDDYYENITYKDLLAAWQARFASLATSLNEHDALVMISHHNTSLGVLSERLSESYGIWNEAFTRMSSSLHITAESQLVLAANAGLFSNEPVKMLPYDVDFCTQTFCSLQKRDYIIRHPNEQDIDRLVELEELCWQHSVTSKAQLLNRVTKNPRGQFVLEKDSRVLGAVYSQRIKDVTGIYQSQAHNVHKLHHPDGEIVQLLAVNIDPEYQAFGYGDQLLEFMLQIGSVMTGVNRIVGVTLCKKYKGDVPFEQYIHTVDVDQDPVLALHRDHGAEVVGAVDDYRPEDEENLHKGVLVSYNIHTRQRLSSSANHSSDNTVAPQEKMSYRQGRDLIYGLVTEQLGGADEFMWDRPVMEMGLDSADLLKLQRLIEEACAHQFQPGFFFKYSTCDKVMAHLIDEGLVCAQQTTEQSSQAKSSTTSAGFNGEDIAIVGMACKLPGGIESPQQLWQALLQQKSLIGEFPTERSDWPDDIKELSLGGFVAGVDEFDAEFFRVMPTEARRMDPQQRMLLQLAWECLEDAGIKPKTIAGTDTGVFVGASNTDYSNLSRELKSGVVAHTASGGSLAVAANRISYYFDISGPSMLIDTACSASMVAMHQACQSIQNSECNMALVGGANLICFPELSDSYHKAGMLSKDGKCKVFDQSADGYVRSEGAVVLLLMPVEKARANKYDIKAVIKGSAVNHGGLSGGLTVPNPTKQGELIETAWRRAGIQVDDVAYIEAHGTGTSLGDPIEIQGIQTAIDSLSPKQEKLNPT